MASQLEIAKRRLFDNDGLHAENVKLFPGTSRDITSEQMAEQINKALAQLETGDFELEETFDF